MSDKARNRFLSNLSDDIPVVSVAGDAIPVVGSLLEASLSSALGRRGMKKLVGKDCLAVVLQVPSSAWIDPLEDVLERICRNVAVVGAVPPRRRSDTPSFDETRAAKSLAEGRTVVVITTDRRSLVPSSFLSTADLIGDLETPSVEAVRRVIAATCTGSARGLKKGDLIGLGLFHLAYAIRPGLARTTIYRLRSATLTKSTETIEWADAPLVDDLQGYGDAKAWAQQVVTDAARHRAGEAVKLTSCLLAGPPGTGKTRLVQSIAKTAGLTLVSTSVASWFSRSAGDLDGVVKALVDVVDRAMQSAPSLLFLDELDAIPSRTSLSSRGRDWWTPVITGCLLEIDRLRGSGKPVVLVAATNHADQIDPAMIRPGRIDRTITMVVPEGEDLVGVFEQYCGRELTREEVRSVVEIVGSATGAQVVAWVEDARRRAEVDGSTLGLQHLLEAVLPHDGRTPAQSRSIAVHEAAHAVVALALGVSVKRLSIVGRDAVGGSTSINGASMSERRADFEAHLAIALAGRVGDEIFGGGADAGAEADLRLATKLACAMRATVGLADTLVHHDPDRFAERLITDRAFAAAVEGDLNRAKGAARDILEGCRELHAEIVEQLIAKQVLDTAAIEAIERGWREQTGSTIRNPKSRATSRNCAV